MLFSSFMLPFTTISTLQLPFSLSRLVVCVFRIVTLCVSGHSIKIWIFSIIERRCDGFPFTFNDCARLNSTRELSTPSNLRSLSVLHVWRTQNKTSHLPPPRFCGELQKLQRNDSWKNFHSHREEVWSEVRNTPMRINCRKNCEERSKLRVPGGWLRSVFLFRFFSALARSFFVFFSVWFCGCREWLHIQHGTTRTNMESHCVNGFYVLRTYPQRIAC